MYRIGSPMFENKRRYNTMQLQESNLAARQPQDATSVIQATTGEGLAQGPYVAARGGVEPTTFRTKGTDNLQPTTPTKVCSTIYSLPYRLLKTDLYRRGWAGGASELIS